jgi:hypothetical protein
MDDRFAGNEKVQQFLVENVARLRMRPIDRALLIAHARREGEETAGIARRFGVSAATVRRLETQLEGATSGEVSALKSGNMNLAVHAIIARYVALNERPDVVAAVAAYSLRPKEMEALFLALGWRNLIALGLEYRQQRLLLLTWACEVLDSLPPGSLRDRICQLAQRLPLNFDTEFRPALVTR